MLVDLPEADSGKSVIYARVSSAEPKDDLNRQTARVVRFASEKGLSVRCVVIEVGSAKRTRLLQLLADPDVQTVLVEHRDRLMRLGFDYAEAALPCPGETALS